MIAIRGELQANPEICRFIVEGREIHPGGTHLCADRAAAGGVRLLEALFAVEGVTQILVSGDCVTLQKEGPRGWPEMGKLVGAVLRQHFESGIPFAPPVRAPRGPAQTEALAARVRELLDAQINPGVASHGGKIELVEIQGSRAVLRMSGGCQGCGSAKATLKQGVEKALRAQIPEITEIVDVTDHSAGKTPYYAPV